MKIRKMLMIALLFFFFCCCFWTGEETYPHGNAK